MASFMCESVKSPEGAPFSNSKNKERGEEMHSGTPLL